VALNNIVLLVGGVGGAKLAHGMAQILPPDALTVIVNTGDDFVHYGLHISPDLDTVMYTLAGLVDRANGWGVAGDTVEALGALRRYGEDAWFRLGDRDMATHLLRTTWLSEGYTLTEVTRRLTKSLGVSQRILPMTDASVPTMIDTLEHGEVPFQVYFVRHRWQPTLRGVRFAGVEQASVTPEICAALDAADVILIAPSNPWLSIAPILAVPGMREAIMQREVPRVAISPIVGGEAVKGPAAKLMGELGLEVSPRTVAAYYGDLINGFVYDERDADLQVSTAHTTIYNTIMHTEEDRAVLSRKVLSWIEGW
jgi:LPPG:FO 2-phospho-L-lactate transferase